MKFEVKENKLLNEKLLIHELDSGMKCFVIPKKGYQEKQAAICTRYGSIDNVYHANGIKHEMPYGMAHFLEHKLFEEENGNIFNTFTKNGADCNAFTNFTTTAYYFNCIDHFDENFQTLLQFTSSLYVTDDSVEKEKGIITQEIMMYRDDPGWMTYFNMLRGLYSKHPARMDIAGTPESISQITKEMLNECYHTFYTPENMAMVVVGDVEQDKIIETVDRFYKKSKPMDIQKEYGEEPGYSAQKYVEKDMNVSMPIFHIGFKENNFEKNQTAVTNVLLDLICGRSSPFYSRMYEAGLIDHNFSCDYTGNLYFGTSVIGGTSKEPKKVAEELINEINKIQSQGIHMATFERIKNKHIGTKIKSYNSLDYTAVSQIDSFTRGTDIIDDFEDYIRLDLKQINQRLHEHLKEDAMTISVVKGSNG